MSGEDELGDTTSFLQLSEPVTAIGMFVNENMFGRLRRFYLT